MSEHAALDHFIATYPYPGSAFEARLDACHQFWESIPKTNRVPLLLEVLNRYRECRLGRVHRSHADDLRASFALNELTSTGYKHRLKPTEAQTIAILHAAHHTCGHGNDAAPPLALALKHFKDKPYSSEFFDAVHAYRDSLRHSKHTTAQELKGRLELIE